MSIWLETGGISKVWQVTLSGPAEISSFLEEVCGFHPALYQQIGGKYSERGYLRRKIILQYMDEHRFFHLKRRFMTLYATHLKKKVMFPN